MIREGEIRKGSGQIQFSLSVLETTQLRPKLKVGISNPTPSLTLTSNAINLSGSQVLVGWLSALCTVGLGLWAIIQLWLFE
jgi:hypothetical protein